MYCIELNGLKWCYETALDAWNNKHLEIRKSCPPMHLDNGAITGVRNFEDFERNLDDGAILQYHTMIVYKVDDVKCIE